LAAIESVAIVGTGLIGASIGLALRDAGFDGPITGWDRSAVEMETALRRGAISAGTGDPFAAATAADCIVLATPVFGILEWIDRLAPALQRGQLVTDAGSTKQAICERAQEAFQGTGASFLPGHPMAGKELHGAAHADAGLFRGAVWLFTPLDVPVAAPGAERQAAWRNWVARFGARPLDIDAERHDVVCAWASHLPQMLGTALAALLEDTFSPEAEGSADLHAIGGRAMREMTRLGASPFSMWRDIAHTNREAIAATLLAMEQRLALLRGNLVEPELRQQFEQANRFRSRF
jgi:prephenate dehydrogenase